MKCNKRLKYNNYVAFSHFHGTAVNNSGQILEIREEVGQAEKVKTCIEQLKEHEKRLSQGKRNELEL